MLINGKSFFEVPVKNKLEAYKKTIDMGKETTITQQVVLLDYECFPSITDCLQL